MILPHYYSPHEVSLDLVRAICALKNQSWPHSMNSQLAWWRENTADNDRLVTLVDEGLVLAFLRLRNRTVLSDGALLDTLCVTEVCVDKSSQGRGLGMQLMNAANEQICQTSVAVGYLLCREGQESFYVKCGWQRLGLPMQIESSAGKRRYLAENERCMILDPLNKLKECMRVFGDVF